MQIISIHWRKTCEDFKSGQKCCHFLKPFLTSFAFPASLCHGCPEFWRMSATAWSLKRIIEVAKTRYYAQFQITLQKKRRWKIFVSRIFRGAGFLFLFFNITSLGLLLVLVSSPPHSPKNTFCVNEQVWDHVLMLAQGPNWIFLVF